MIICNVQNDHFLLNISLILVIIEDIIDFQKVLMFVYVFLNDILENSE
jgi:hypothetical protein